MAFVQKAVARLDEKEKLDALLEELGKAHFYYGAPKKYIDVSPFLPPFAALCQERRFFRHIGRNDKREVVSPSC